MTNVPAQLRTLTKLGWILISPRVQAPISLFKSFRTKQIRFEERENVWEAGEE